MHHAVVAVPHPQAATGPLAPVLRLSAVGLAVRGPAAGLADELLGPQRRGLGKQCRVGLDGFGAGLLDGLGEPLGVGLRHPPRLHRVAHRGRGLDHPGGVDLAAGLVVRQPGGVGQHLGAAVAMALSLGDDASRAGLER